MDGALKYQTTAGWSLIISGLATLLLTVLPGASVWWGLALLVIGIVVLVIRKKT